MQATWLLCLWVLLGCTHLGSLGLPMDESSEQEMGDVYIAKDSYDCAKLNGNCLQRNCPQGTTWAFTCNNRMDNCCVPD
ncbi:hypothetical protein XENTR_v10015144 [Xenopus tropicalis]|uniref:Small cysteine-rich protein 1-like n=1 Tax=Xenopus tropicalis TaxID=8364 RepID=A0A8J1JM26_XENTR|nr:small cysteine-rich protein 1-like [Xenopus tropicalis]KAE8605450.1 hypothetical protein XENTR_v10015144 [Xenopus tropicalis]